MEHADYMLRLLRDCGVRVPEPVGPRQGIRVVGPGVDVADAVGVAGDEGACVAAGVGDVPRVRAGEEHRGRLLRCGS